MNKTRLPVVIMTLALFSTAILALLTYRNSAGALGGSRSSSGFGDLRLFEAQQNNASGKALERGNPYVGMGELRRFEAGQLLATTHMSLVQLPERICPQLSTSYGERDAGASTPDIVLRAQGCQMTQ